MHVTPTGLVEGYASLFATPDLARDVVEPGAFRASLATRAAPRVRMLWQHDPAEPIGSWETIVEDARGLYVRGRLAGSRRGRDAAALLAAGAVDGLSIGFRTVSARRDAARGVRRLDRIDLWEISLVTFPMLPGARVKAVEARARLPPAGDGVEALRALATALRAA